MHGGGGGGRMRDEIADACKLYVGNLTQACLGLLQSISPLLIYST